MNTFVSHVRISLTATAMLLILLCVAYPLVVWGAAQLVFSSKANGSLITKADGTVIGSAIIGQPFSDPKYFHPRPSAAGGGYDPTASSGSNLGPTSAKLINGTTKVPPPADPVAGAPVVAAPAATDPATVAAPPAPVVDFDGIKLRVFHYCDDNGIPCEVLQDGKPIDVAVFKAGDGWDEVKLITGFNDADHPLTVKAGTRIPVDAVTASASGLDPHISVANALLQAPRVAKARKLDDGTVQHLIASRTEQPDFGILGEDGVNVLRLNLALDQQQ